MLKYKSASPATAANIIVSTLCCMVLIFAPSQLSARISDAMSNKERADMAQAAIDALVEDGGPGIVGSVWRDGAPVFTATAGLADLETGRAITVSKLV